MESEPIAKDLTDSSESDSLSNHQRIRAVTDRYYERKVERMGIVSVEKLPARKRAERKSKYPFSAEEVTAAVKEFKKTGRVGAGPYDKTPQQRGARSAAQRLKALVCEAGDIDPATVRTTAWEDDNGAWAALVRKDAPTTE